MGEAKRRGSFIQRKNLAVETKVKKFVESHYDFSDIESENLRKGYEFLKQHIHPNDWGIRRETIINYLNKRPTEYSDPESKIRFSEDEIGWYIFLCEEYFRNPSTTEYAQLSRISPFIVCLGSRVDNLNKVKGIEKKLKDLVKKYKSNPDGLIYEILIASSYLIQGFEVEFLEEIKGEKTPDLRVWKETDEYYIECKKLNRRTDYAEKEKVLFLEAWNKTQEILLKKFRNFWFKIEIKIDILDSPINDFIKKFEKIDANNDSIYYEDDEVKIIGEKKNLNRINNYLENNYVKINSYMMSKLLGGDFVFFECERTHILAVRTFVMSGAVAPVLGTYVDRITGFVGATREFVNPASQDAKSREITNHVKEALKQLSNYRPCIVHVMYEALESSEVEQLRFNKISNKMDEVVLALDLNISVKINRIQNLQTPNILFDILETTKIWGEDFGFNIFDIIPN